MILNPVAPGADDALGLWYFQTDPASIRTAVAAGIGAFMVDWENKAKVERQSGRDTEINFDTAEDLARTAAVPGASAICRINGSHDGTPKEIEAAISAGAAMILLPMVETPAEVERLLRWVDERIPAGILIETAAALTVVDDLAGLPIAAAYVGLNDLSISLGRRHIFETVVDGTVERITAKLAEHGVPSGWGGVTVVDGGAPVPCRLLMADLHRTGGRFCFLRRSFRRDIAGRNMTVEVAKIQRTWIELGSRSDAEIRRDRDALASAVRALG